MAYHPAHASSPSILALIHTRRAVPARRFWRTAFGSLGVLAALVLVLAGCGSSSTGGGTSGPKTGGTLNVALDSDVVTLDPLKSSALVDREVMLNMYDTLVRVDAQNNIQPDLATSWSYPSPTQVVFTLRTGVKFQDGTPFNADAVVTNINRILNTPSSPRHSELVTKSAAVSSVQSIDDTHVQFNLNKPFTPLLATLTDRSGMILSPAVIQSLGTQLANGPTNAGSGPFMFKEWVKGDHLTIQRNPTYWKKDSAGRTLPYLDSVTYHPITDGSVRFTNLETGTINVAEDLNPTDVASAKSNPNLVYNQIAGLSFFGFELNTKKAPLDNVHVRRAIAWATNRQEILTSVLHNIGVLSQGPLSPSSWAYSASIAPYSYNVDTAKSELAQANMTSVTFDMDIASGSPVTLQEAQFIQQELQPAGITVNIKQETFAAQLADSQAHNYQASLIGWSGRPDPDGNMYSWFHTGGGNNDMQYSNPQVDAALEDARASSDQAKRASDYQQAEQLMLQESPYVFINHGVSEQATTKNVHNFTLLPTTIMVFTETYLA
jgi:peptide/nickel transport system substrate-binding protein